MIRIFVRHWYRMFKISLATQLMRWAAKIDIRVFVTTAFTYTELNYDEFQEWSIDKMRENA